MELRISSDIWRSVRRDLEACYPEEGCGLLAGLREKGVTVKAYWPVRNLEEGIEARRRYLIGPQAFLVAEREARKQGLEIVGAYHSHPDVPPVPSEVDRERAWPWYYYLIVEVRCGRADSARAWELKGDRSGFEERRIILLEE